MTVVGIYSNDRVFCQHAKPLLRCAIRLRQVAFRTILLFAIACRGSLALAVGFTEMRVQSSLGQPLRVQIGLLGSEEVESRCFKAKITSLDGVPLGAVNITAKNEGSISAIVLSTTQSVNEPAVTLGVEYNCASQSRREYQILLDLPAITLPIVDTSHSAAAAVPADKHPSESAQQPSSVPSVADRGAESKKARRRRLAAESVANDKPIRPQLALANEVQENHVKKPASRSLRDVLRVGSDDGADDNLNGAEGMHLALSHSLLNPTMATDAKHDALASTDASVATQVPAQASAPVTDESAHAADAGLQELMAKIRVLEAETGELRKLNAKHLTALENTKKSQDSGNSLLYLYFLLFVCVAAIAWLIWRMKQIQSELAHSSWRQIVPEDESTDEYEKEYEEKDEDPFPAYDRILPDIKSVAALKQAPSTTVMNEPVAASFANKQVRQHGAAATSEDANESDYKFFANVRSVLPNAEEILDEIQQAEFWMDMQQPQRAIEILESNWSGERPSSPLPWLYLFDLYRMVGNKENYEELTKHFEHIFNGKVVPWGDGKALERTRTLEEFPILMKRIIQLWQTDELVPFMESLLIDDRDGRRQGFDLDAYREILFLTNIAYEIQGSKDTVDPSPKTPEWSAIR